MVINLMWKQSESIGSSRIEYYTATSRSHNHKLHIKNTLSIYYYNHGLILMVDLLCSRVTVVFGSAHLSRQRERICVSGCRGGEKRG